MSTEAQIRASMNYNKKMDYFGLRPSKDEGEQIRAAAAAAGMSNQAYILEAIREKMTRDAPESVSNAAEASTEAAHTSTESPTERDSALGVDVPGTPGNAAESG